MTGPLVAGRRVLAARRGELGRSRERPPPLEVPPARVAARAAGCGRLASAPPSHRSPAVTVSVVVLATSATAEGTPRASLPLGEGTLLGRVIAAAHARDAEVTVLTRARWEADVRATAGPVEVRPVADRRDVLAALADLPDGPVVVLPGDLAVHAWAVATVLGHPGAGSAALVGPLEPVGEGAVPVRAARGRLTAVGSRHHEVAAPTGRSVGVLRLGVAAREALAARTDELVALPGPGQDPDGELLAELATGTVRSSVPVAQVRLTTGVWRRPATRAEAEQAHAALTAVDEEQVRLRAAVKADDGFFTTFLVSSYSPHLARFAARRGWTPDQVTVTSMLLGVLAAVAFADGGRGWAIVGAVLLQLAFTLDCVDGQLARYTLRFSARGAWLDAVFDRGKEYAVYAGLAVGGARLGQDGVWTLAALALAVQTVRHTVDFGYAATQVRDLTVPWQPLDRREEVGPLRWEPAATAAGDSVAARGVTLLRDSERVGAVRWAKKVVVLPIGERFALLSVLAATTSPRTTFVVLLVWSVLAAGYTTLGRVVRAFA